MAQDPRPPTSHSGTRACPGWAACVGAGAGCGCSPRTMRCGGSERWTPWRLRGNARPATRPPTQSAWTERGPAALRPRAAAHAHGSVPQDLIKVHHSFLRAVDVAMMAGGSALAKVFLDFKER